jgi:hypothetical protein
MRWQHRIELAQDGGLGGAVLKDGFDHHVRGSQVGVVCRGADARQQCLGFASIHAAFFHQAHQAFLGRLFAAFGRG